MKPVLQIVSTILVAGILIVLLGSVLYSGIYYQYDRDELSHAQYTYLLLTGAVPYKDIYMRFTPLFYWIIAPVFQHWGFTFDAIHQLRWVMAAIFLARLGMLYVLFRLVWGHIIAIGSICLLLLDPFTPFTAIQIRPDNLMMLMYTIALSVLLVGMKRSSNRELFFAGTLFISTLLILPKIFPALAVILLVISGYYVQQKQWRAIMALLFGCALPVLLFFGYAYTSGVLSDMIQQTVHDSVTLNDSMLFPTFASYFYRPDNLLLFGSYGRPLTWWFIWILPVLAATGIVWMVVTLKRQRFQNKNIMTPIQLAFIASLAVQLVWIFTYPGGFIQYFLSVNWLMAGFASVSLVSLWQYVRARTPYHRVIPIIYCVALLLFAGVSIRANLFRATVGNGELISRYEDMWKRIPENEPTFQNMLFRPLAYYFAHGTFIGDMSKSLINRFGPIHESLERQHVNYVLVDSFAMMFLHPQTQEYIHTHYSEQKEGFWVRK